MATTPQDTRDRIDQAIDSLNAQWDLRLPKLTGAEADRAAIGPDAGKCSGRIRALYYKTKNIDAILEDFSEQARQLQSQWVFKPSQERGTLPVLPQTKSLMERDFQIKRRARLVQLSDPQRLVLQKRLFAILNENWELAKETDSYSTERASSASFATAPSTPRKQTVARKQETVFKSGRQIVKASETVVRGTSVFLSEEEPQLKNPMTKSTKRTLGSPEGVSLTSTSAAIITYLWSQQNKRKQPQQITLSQFVQRQPAQNAVSLHNDPVCRPEQTSFETIPSPEASVIFSSRDEGEDPASNATSMISTQADESQDLFPTQDANDFFDDEQFETSFAAACNDANESMNLSSASRHKFVTPFRVQAQLPQDVPFWYNWELFRIAPLLSIKPLDLHKRLEKEYSNTVNDAEELWEAIKQLYSQKGLTLLPPKSILPTWVTKEQRYEDDSTNRTIYLTATLDKDDGPAKDSYQLRLKATQIEKPCRFYRRFGADRFLVLSIPSFDPGVPHQKEIIDFLSSESHFIAGRYWRICYVEDDKKLKGRKKITMFAERGFDILGSRPINLDVADIRLKGRHQQMTILDLTEWHMPLDANSHSKDLKLFSRWAIGFSKTTATIAVRQHEFQYLPDEPGKPVMNDGCALMSLPLANAIWAAYGGEGKVPSAVQGRIGGAKGLWLVDYNNKYKNVSERDFWIEISDSQLKIKPHPRDRTNTDAHQRTFEVLKYAKSAIKSRLNMQLVTILEDRGVPRRVLQDALVADLESYSSTLRAAMLNPVKLRSWLQQHGRSSHLRKSQIMGSFPRDNVDQMELLLASGFHPQECKKLINNAYKLLSQHMSNYMKKLWIGLPQSTTVFCAPDPLGVLEEGEVFISFSKDMPVNGSEDTILADMEVLLARNPAYLPSDIQRRKAVFKEELRHYKNIILFPTRGNVPLASLLSGGDYDGDTCQVIWDQDFVMTFQNVDVPNTRTESDCGMIQMSKPLRQIFNPFRSRQDAFEDFLRGCVDFNVRPHSLGICSSEYQALVYNLSLQQREYTLFHQGLVTLAALAGFQVDCNKQGWYLPNKAWNKLRREASGRKGLATPAYKEEHAPRKTEGTFPNVIDFLKFEVAAGLRDTVLEDFQKLETGQTVLKYDRSLSMEWLYWFEPINEHKEKTKRLERLRSAKAGKLPPVSGNEPLSLEIDILADMLDGNNGLHQMVDGVQKLWRDLAKSGGFISTQDDPDTNNFNRSVQTVYEKFRSIEPNNERHEFYRRYQAQKDNYISGWALLRASCLHYWACKDGKTPVWLWYVAGRELCWLKAMQHPGGVRPVVLEIFDLFKVDPKRARLLQDDESIEENGLDNAGDEDNFLDFGAGGELD